MVLGLLQGLNTGQKYFYGHQEKGDRAVGFSAIISYGASRIENEQNKINGSEKMFYEDSALFHFCYRGCFKKPVSARWFP